MRATMMGTLDLNEVRIFLRRFYRERFDEGYGWQELSEYTGVSATAISMWVKGSRPIVKVEVLQKLLVGYQQWTGD